MKIFAVVVTYNGMRWYDRCFGSLRDSETPVETIVIDNASTDETVPYIKGRFPEICLIESKENLGFARANNIGIRRALDNGADYVFLLNQDAWVEKDTLTKLVQTFEDNENVGIVSPMHLNGKCTALDWGFVKYVPDEFISDSYMQKLNKYYQLKFVNAAAWLVSIDCIRKVGGFDTLLFVHYDEDDNYCQRVLYHGYKILINTMVTICHDRGFRSKDSDWEYRNSVFLQENNQMKVKLGDINKDVDFIRIKHDLKKSIFKSLVKLSYKELKVYKERLKLVGIINESRHNNIKGGLVWLNI